MNKWYPKNGRVILHVDMNSFYASVEIADDPNLKNKPVAIAGNPDERKGIIVTSSYEARNKGVKTTMPLWEARKLCPDLIVIRPNFPRYREISQQIFKHLETYTEFVEPVSIDEAYMDITKCAHIGSPLEIAKMIREELRKELGLPCSIGISPNKFLAKMASDMKKPNGITILRKRDVETRLWPLLLEQMYGVGKKTAEKLQKYDIHTIGDLVRADTHVLKAILGVNGERLQARAKGEDPRPVDPDQAQAFKSIGSSMTFPMDIDVYDELIVQLQDLSKKVAFRLERKKAVGNTIQLVIRYNNRHTVTRRIKLPHFIEKPEQIFYYSETLLSKHWNGEPVRLLGITMQNTEKKDELFYQINLFDYLDELP